ncbi:uncharacterized [Tachysurus ichikawai]
MTRLALDHVILCLRSSHSVQCASAGNPQCHSAGVRETALTDVPAFYMPANRRPTHALARGGCIHDSRADEVHGVKWLQPDYYSSHF